MLRVIFRQGHSCHINYDDQCRGLLDVQQCHHSGPQHGCRILKNIIQTVWIWCHVCRFFSTSLEESATRSWGSAVWSAPAAEDFLRTKGWLSSIGKRATLAVWRICMWDYSSVFTRCVSKVVCRDDWLRVFTQYTYQMPGHLVCSIHHCLHNSGFRCPTCLFHFWWKHGCSELVVLLRCSSPLTSGSGT